MTTWQQLDIFMNLPTAHPVPAPAQRPVLCPEALCDFWRARVSTWTYSNENEDQLLSGQNSQIGQLFQTFHRM